MDKEIINATIEIDGVEITVPEGISVLEAAKLAGIDIPTLCYLKDINEVGACRMCVVEVEGAKALQAACVYPVCGGMVIHTKTKRVRNARKSTLELILSNHNRECTTCVRSENCELQKLAKDLGISDIPYDGIKEKLPIDNVSPSIVRDPNKCILCGRCISTCKNVQKIGVLEFVNRGFDTRVAPAFEVSMQDSSCIYCGQCIQACPVAALREKDDLDRVWEALDDPEKFVVVQTAPAVRAALGEEFGYPIGTRVTGKMVDALKKIGFNKVFDTNFAADLTIIEEGTELLGRIKNGGVLPMITSCSPGWIRYCEYNYPDLLGHLSSCKSPHQMMGAILKTYYAEKNNINPKKMFVVSIMPCTSKKSEIVRPEMGNDVDAVLTTRELARMIKQARINFQAMSDDAQFDQDLLGEYTGAGVIFGATGGVMEAAIRTVADIVGDTDLKNVDYVPVRGVEGLKEAQVTVGDMTIKVAVAHGTANAKKVMDMIKEGKADYHFIEIMGCSGGCVCGGGQPHVTSKALMDIDVRVERAKALYKEDTLMPQRKSHKNSQVMKLYEDFLGEPNGQRSHRLLHTHYSPKEKYPVKSK
ncbi:MAG: 2Fe-2S iron-sulfur cluster binding domain-containing protein [Clostridiales bacterium]|nr:2Fe-2S iron-sulfur cluster binding domain-containing protein [Clostridiales bacterium]